MSLKEKVTNYDVQIMKYIHTHWDLSIGTIVKITGLSRSYVNKLFSGVEKPSVKSKEPQTNKDKKEIKMKETEDKTKRNVFTYRPDLERTSIDDQIPDRTPLEEEAYKLKMKRNQQE